jgi:ABC-type transport system involved in cytochrome bd biosynthesis fused ATPase/permease subunit
MERAREQFRIPRKNEEEMILYVRLAHTHIDDLEIQAKTLRIFDRDDRETAQMVASEKQKKQDTMTIEYRRNEKASWESIGADEK